MVKTPSEQALPKISFESPLFLDERIAADWDQMRTQISSATQLEAAYRLIESDVAEFDLELTEAEVEQIIDFYNKTVVDGRYITDLTKDPARVAGSLGVQLSDKAVAAIKQTSKLRLFEDGIARVPFVGPIAVVGIVVIAVVIVIDPRMKKELVIDSSGRVKL